MGRIVTVLVVAVLSTCAYTVTASTATSDSLQVSADQVLSALVEGNVEPVVALLHYPALYSKEERATDAAGITKALEFLLSTLGPLEAFEQLPGNALGYELALSAGDVAYWESLSPLHTIDVVYKGSFTKFGDGFVVVSFFETKSGMSLRAVDFRLDPSVPRARDTAIDICVELLRQQAESAGEPLPDHARELVSASIPDLSGDR